MSDKDWRSAFGRFTTGVTVVCSGEDSHRRGFTANSFVSVSLSPPLVSVCLDASAQCRDVFSVCRHFAVSVLAAEQEDIARHFADFSGDRFADTAWSPAPSGSPVIEHCLAWFDCACEQHLSLGDHIMLIGRVEDCAYSAYGDGAPLLYFGGGYARISADGE